MFFRRLVDYKSECFGDKMKLIIILLSLISYSDVIVESKSGDVKVQTNGEWINISDTLNLNDLIKLSGNSNLTLNKDGKTYSISKSGVYSIAKITTDKVNTDVTNKYVTYLIGELAEADNMLAEGNLQDNMNTLGAVERAFSKESILGLPRDFSTIPTEVKFEWKLDGTNTFRIMDGGENVIYSVETDSDSLIIDLSLLNLEHGDCYWWSVDNSEQCCLFILEDYMLADVESEIEIISNEIDIDTPFGSLVIARIYENYKMTDKAYEYYIKSIESNQDKYKLLKYKFEKKIGL